MQVIPHVMMINVSQALMQQWQTLIFGTEACHTFNLWTGQHAGDNSHREMIKQVIEFFSISVPIMLEIYYQQ